MVVKKQALGRGLAALLGDDPTGSRNFSGTEGNQSTSTSSQMIADAGHSQKYLELPLSSVRPNPGQPRRIWDDAALEELAASIKTYGVLQPIIVQRAEEGHYDIIAGERRWRASQKAGLSHIPVVVHTLETIDRMKIALVENIQRVELSALEEAMAYDNLMELYAFTQETLATTLGKSRSYIANMLRLNKLHPAVKQALGAGAISYGHARCLINVDQADVLVQYIIANKLSVRETEVYIRGQTQRPLAPRPKKAPAGKSYVTPAESSGSGDMDIDALEGTLTEVLGAKVHIIVSDKEKKIVVYFDDFHQLDDILQKML